MNEKNKFKDTDQSSMANYIDPKEWDRLGKQVEEIQALEKELPILAQTPESLQLFADRSELNYAQGIFNQKLEETPIKAALQNWLRDLNPGTQKNYAYYVMDMIRKDIIPERDANNQPFTVGHFNYINHARNIDYMKSMVDLSEGTRQLRTACYISFTAHLERISNGWFRKAVLHTLHPNPAFYRIHNNRTTQALSLSEWRCFIDALSAINKRDSLIARCMFQGARRISEALTIQLNQIDFEKNIIRFKQKKTGGKEISISYPEYYMLELKEYVELTREARKNSEYLFITNKGNPVTRVRFNYSFAKASEVANIQKVTPHMLRATRVALMKKEGIQDIEIMKVTGLTTSKMIHTYGVNNTEDNHTKRSVLI